MGLHFNKTPLACVAVLTLSAASASAQTRPVAGRLPPELQEILTRWLRHDCGVGGEVREITVTLAKAGPMLEEALWEAFEMGPAEEVREELQGSLGNLWLLRHRWLEEHGTEAVGRDQARRLLGQTDEEFRIEEDVKQVARWQDAALSGLAVVCTERSVERLRSLAKDERQPRAAAARLALEVSGNCSSRR